MEYKTLVCQDCGYKKKVKFCSEEEAEKRKIPLLKPRCEKCGSYNVKYDD